MARGLIKLVTVSAIVLAVGALALLRPPVVDRMLPPAVVGWLDGLRGMTSIAGPAPTVSDNPADFLADTAEGLVATGPIAALAGNRPVFIDRVVSGYRTDAASGVPAEITTIRPILGCRLTAPLPGTVVGHVTAGRSGLPMALSSYNDTHLATAVQRFVDDYRDAGTATPVTAPDIVYQAYDVAVTDTSAPVYLVLETGAGNRIWNLHLAEGARVERVVLLGGGQAGIANLDPVVPLEVILDDGLAACGIRPAHALNPGHRLLQPDGSLTRAEAEALLANHQTEVMAYDIWLRDSFDLASGASRAGFEVGTLSVVGPVPDEVGPLAIYAPLAASRIRTTQDTFFEITGQVAQGSDFASRVVAIATAFAFGDLATLRQGVSF